MQDPFLLSTFMPYRLAVLAERASRRLMVEYSRTHGLNVAEWRVLVHLLRCGTVSVKDIHNCVNLEKPRVSRAVTRLETAGLVAKLVGKEDARLVEISLTQPGRDAVNEIIPVALTIEGGLLEGVSAQELEVFCAVMERMHANLDADPEARPRSRLDTDLPES